jgi:tetratricopeptide (TPR) repeat protein
MDFDRAIALHPEEAWAAYINRAWIFAERGEYQQALDNCKHALQLDIHSEIVYADRGRVYLWQGDYSSAEADCERALEIAPTCAEAYGVRGLLYYQQKQYTKAQVDFAQAQTFGQNLYWIQDEYSEVCRIVDEEI